VGRGAGIMTGSGADSSGQLHRSVIVAMVAMGMVQSSVHEVIDMIPVGNTFVPAGRVMRVCTARFWRTPHRIGITDLDRVLVNMIFMHMMKMPIVKIIDVVLMAYCCMSAIRTVPMSMVRVLLLATSGHRVFPSFRCRVPFWRPSTPSDDGRECKSNLILQKEVGNDWNRSSGAVKNARVIRAHPVPVAASRAYPCA
jgi:hypothetical protein